MKILLLSGWLLFALMSLAACEPQAAESAESQAATAPPPVNVSTIKIDRQDVPVHFEYVGQVAGSLQVEIRSRVSGIIEKRHFTEGSDVKAGQLLFSIDAAPFEARYKQALAAIETARAQKLSAQAQLKQARRELERVRPLADKQMLSQERQDDALSAVDVAQAQVSVADAAIKQAEANLLSARIDLDYTKIRAPIDGVIGRTLKNRGALVQSGEGSLLASLVQLDPVYVNFGIPETELIDIRRRIKNGSLQLSEDGYRIELINEQGLPSGYSGRLDFQDYKVDNNTGNFASRAELANPDRTLAPGQFVRVRMIGLISRQAIAIPQRAVLDGPTGKYVYVVAKSEQGSQIAQQKMVTMGEWVDLGDQRNNYWIVHSGLQIGDEVIVDGVARIFFPGMAVQPDAENSQSDANASPVS